MRPSVAASIDGDVIGAFSFAMPVVRFNQTLERGAVDLLTRTTDLLDLQWSYA